MSMSTYNDGGPAFPNIAGPKSFHHDGMTLRDWFAGQALQGQCACPVTAESWGHKVMAKQAYEQADAMIAARKESQP